MSIELQVGVKALLKNKEGKYLLLRRNPEKYKDIKGDWDIVGGRINPGLPLLDNLKREITEEVNLDLTDQPKLAAAQDILRIKGRHVVRLTFTANIDGDPELNDESLEFNWFAMTELKAMNDQELDIYFKELLDTGKIN